MVYYYDLSELIEILEDDGYLVYDSVERFVDENLEKVIKYLKEKYPERLIEAVERVRR